MDDNLHSSFVESFGMLSLDSSLTNSSNSSFTPRPHRFHHNQKSKSQFNLAMSRYSHIDAKKRSAQRINPMLRNHAGKTYDFYRNNSENGSNSSSSTNKYSTDSLDSSKGSYSRKVWSLTSSSDTESSEEDTSSTESRSSRQFYDMKVAPGERSSVTPRQTLRAKQHEQVHFFNTYLCSMIHDKHNLLSIWGSLPETIRYQILGLQVRTMCEAFPEKLFQATKLLGALIPECPFNMQEFIAEKLQNLRMNSPHFEVRRAAMEVLVDSGILLKATKYHPAYRLPQQREGPSIAPS